MIESFSELKKLRNNLTMRKQFKISSNNFLWIIIFEIMGAVQNPETQNPDRPKSRNSKSRQAKIPTLEIPKSKIPTGSKS
jgi:hypothetical protein